MDAAVKVYQSVTQREARDRLVLEHLPYVRHLLGRIQSGLPQGVDLENLEAAGILGLVEAANQFDPSREVEFRSFAHHRIRGAILDELRRNCPLPQQMLQRWTLIRNASERLGGRATMAAIAAECELTESDVEECFQAMRLTQPDEWDEELASPRRVQEEQEVSRRLTDEEERTILADAITRLPDRLRTVLSLYYLEDLRLLEIGEVLGLSESRVSRLLSRAEFELKLLIDPVLVTGEGRNHDSLQ